MSKRPYALLVFFFFSTFSLLGVWAVSSPIGSSPDDGYHLNSIWCSWGDCDYCRKDASADSPSAVLIPNELRNATCFIRQWPTFPLESPSCQIATRGDLKLVTSNANTDLHPNLYYSVQRVFASQNIEMSVIAMRLFNALLAAALLSFAYWTISPRLQIGLLSTWLLMMFPLTAFIVSSVNPSAWAFLGVGTFWAFFSEVLSPSPKRHRWWSVLGTIITICLVVASRRDATAFVVVIGVTLLLTQIRATGLLMTLRSKIQTRTFWIWLVCSLIASLAGIVYVQRLIFGYFNLDFSFDTNWGLYLKNLVDLPTFVSGAFGSWGRPEWPLGLGWFDIYVPAYIPLIAISLTGFVIFDNLRHATKRTKAVVLGLIAFLIISVLQTLQARQSTGDHFLQPRYIAPLLIAIIGISATPYKNIAGLSAKSNQILIPILLIISGSISLHSNIGRWTLNRDAVLNSLPVDLSSHKTWWWNIEISPNAVWVLGIVSTACFIISALILINKADELNQSSLQRPENN